MELEAEFPSNFRRKDKAVPAVPSAIVRKDHRKCYIVEAVHVYQMSMSSVSYDWEHY